MTAVRCALCKRVHDPTGRHVLPTIRITTKGKDLIGDSYDYHLRLEQDSGENIPHITLDKFLIGVKDNNKAHVDSERWPANSAGLREAENYLAQDRVLVKLSFNGRS